MKKNKLIFTLVFATIFFQNLFAQNNYQNNITKFIKGDISEKTQAVREASGAEVIWISNQALDFVIEYKGILGSDRDLEGLAVAAILSIPTEYCKSASDKDKQVLLTKFINLFQTFDNNSTVQIAVLSKFLYLKDIFPTASFTELLNDYLKRTTISSADPSVIKAVINTLGTIGNNTSFVILYNFWNNNHYKEYYPEIENSIKSLAAVSMNEIIQIVKSQSLQKVEQLFTLIKENESISPNNLSEIAENVLNVAILQIGNTTESTRAAVSLQMESIRILDKNNWTRASKAAVTFLGLAAKEYKEETMSESEFIEVICSMKNVAPINSVGSLTTYLVDLNSVCEQKEAYAVNVVIAVIETLGAIGDKSAFDSLLAVTYLNYPESVLSAAREALAGLKW